MNRLWIPLVAVIVAHEAIADPPLEIPHLLMGISIQTCETASFSNVVHVISPSVAALVNVKEELGTLSPGLLLISARVFKTRLVRWPIGLESDEMAPLVEPWARSPSRAPVYLLYYSSGRSCSDAMHHLRKGVVVSTNYGECDSWPPRGWCIITKRQIVSDVPGQLKQYVTATHWWQRK